MKVVAVILTVLALSVVCGATGCSNEEEFDLDPDTKSEEAIEEGAAQMKEAVDEAADAMKEMDDELRDAAEQMEQEMEQ